MGKRSRLFASAAFPLLSFSLAFEPAAAAALREQPIAPLNNGIAATTDAAASFEVAQQAAPAGESEEEQLKHKKPAEGEPGQKPEGQGGAEPQHQKKQAEPEGEQQQKPPKEQPEAQPPKAQRQQPAEQEQPKPEAKEPAAEAPQPKKHQQPAEEQQPQPQAQPEAKPQPKAVAPEAAPEAPQPKQKGKQPEAKQPVEAPQPKVEQQQPAAEAQPEAKPAPKAKPEPKAQQPAPAQKEAPAATEPQNQQEPAKQAQPEQNTKPKQQGETANPAQQPAEQQPAGQPPKGQKTQPETQGQPEAQPGTQVAPGTEQGQKPGDKTHGKQPQNQQQGEQPAANPQQPAQKGEPQGQPAQPGNQATPQPGKQQPGTGAETPAQGTATPAPANGNGQQAGEIQLPPAEQVSPQELERRKKIAENPASANGSTVILPVQNGGAVLDSQKDAVRRGEHQNGGQNPGAPSAQGDHGKAGQGQNGQAQNNPAQQPPPAYTKPPTSDADSQRAAPGGQPQPPVKIEAVTSEQGRRIDRRPDFVSPQGTTVQTIINQDNRTIVNVDNTYVVRHDDTDRFIRGGERPTYEQLPRDRYRETIDQPDGDRVITIRNRYGDIIQRSRIDARGREYVLFYSPELEQQPDHDDYFRDPGDSLPPMRLLIPLSQYIIDTASNRNTDYYDFLREPPVEPVERIYSVNEVRYSARIRDKIRRIDLDTITFATGSADIPMTQASTLRGVADGISKVIQRDPTETFLIEGHTDAVGSAESNLLLSDRRAESVANILSDVYGIPAENLVTQGYGEQYLKVNTTGPSQENRRVTIRRITPLVRPVASNR